MNFSSTLNSTTYWSIGNGNKTQFWNQPWVEGINTLSEHAIADIPPDDIHKKVKDYVTNGAWDIKLLKSFLPRDIVHKIEGIHPPSPHN